MSKSWYNLFWCSDFHFFHSRIISYAKRPFRDVDHMNETLINNWNKVVPEHGSVFILGDFSFAKDQEYTQRIIGRLNGRNKFLIKGNHDQKLSPETLSKFTDVFDYMEHMVPTETGKQLIVMSHYPMLVWNRSHYGSYMLHGHSHSTLPDDPNALRLDVGVDCPYAGYAPISFETIQALMKKKTFKPIDHHRPR